MRVHFSASRRQHFCRSFSGEKVGLATVILFLLFGAWYAGSYYYLARRGMREAKPCNMPGFFYVPLQEVFEKRDLSRHYSLMRFYGPANLLDRALFGGEWPITGVLWGLTRGPEQAVPESSQEKTSGPSGKTELGFGSRKEDPP